MSSLFTTILPEGTVTAPAFFVSTICAILTGCLIAFVFSKVNRCSRSFAITLCLMPAIVELIIMLVNGNIGAGVAVAGAFGLVRFRSAAGSGEEITAVFLAMAAGLACGMGYVLIAVLFVLIMVILDIVLNAAAGLGLLTDRTLKITVPESLHFEGEFDSILNTYTDSSELLQVRTAEMGSVYKLSYRIRMKAGASVQKMMDSIRERNGNLEVSCQALTGLKTEEL